MLDESDHFHEAQGRDEFDEACSQDSDFDPMEGAWWLRKAQEFDGGKEEVEEAPPAPPETEPEEPKTPAAPRTALLIACSVVFCLLLSAGLTWAKWAGATTPQDTFKTLVANAPQDETAEGWLLARQFSPPSDEAASLQFDSQGISYNGTQLGEKFIILRTRVEKQSRGLTLGIVNHAHWIDIATLALKKRIKIVSLTHAGTEEPWFNWNDEGHKHDEQGAALRIVEDTNRLMVERGITHLLIDTTSYTGTETWEFQVIQEQIVRTAFWRHYMRIQMLSGCLSFALQVVRGFRFDGALTYAGVAAVVAFSTLEKVDFLKDLQVAWAFPHASPAYAFLMWVSITVPTFSLFFFFLSIGRWKQFAPAFLGYAELMREQPDGEKTGDFLELVQKQGQVMDEYNALMAGLTKHEKTNGPFALAKRRAIYAAFENAALIKLDIEATIQRRIMRFAAAGLIILIENSLQMTIFYEDQLTVGNSWAWYLSAAPMLSNVLYSTWCGTIGPALYYIF